MSFERKKSIRFLSRRRPGMSTFFSQIWEISYQIRSKISANPSVRPSPCTRRCCDLHDFKHDEERAGETRLADQVLHIHCCSLLAFHHWFMDHLLHATNTVAIVFRSSSDFYLSILLNDMLIFREFQWRSSSWVQPVTCLILVLSEQSESNRRAKRSFREKGNIDFLSYKHDRHAGRRIREVPLEIGVVFAICFFFSLARPYIIIVILRFLQGRPDSSNSSKTSASLLLFVFLLLASTTRTSARGRVSGRVGRPTRWFLQKHRLVLTVRRLFPLSLFLAFCGKCNLFSLSLSLSLSLALSQPQRWK